MNVYSILGGIFLCAAIYLGGIYTGERLAAGKYNKAALTAETHAIQIANVQTKADEKGFAVTAKTIETDNTTFDSLKGGAYALPLLNPITGPAPGPINFAPAFRVCWDAASDDTSSPACQASPSHAAVPVPLKPPAGQLRDAAGGRAGQGAGAGTHR